MITDVSLIEIVKSAVDGMAPVRLNNAATAKVHFEEGDEQALYRFIRLKGEYLPLIWLLPYSPTIMEYGLSLEASVSFNLCVRETRQQLMNIQRDDLSFRQVLRPLVKDFLQALWASHQVVILEETITTEEIKNFTPSDGNPDLDVWDVLRLTFTCQFTKKDKCHAKFF